MIEVRIRLKSMIEVPELRDKIGDSTILQRIRQAGGFCEDAAIFEGLHTIIETNPFLHQLVSIRVLLALGSLEKSYIDVDS